MWSHISGKEILGRNISALFKCYGNLYPLSFSLYSCFLNGHFLYIITKWIKEYRHIKSNLAFHETLIDFLDYFIIPECIKLAFAIGLLCVRSGSAMGLLGVRIRGPLYALKSEAEPFSILPPVSPVTCIFQIYMRRHLILASSRKLSGHFTPCIHG